MTLTLSFLWLAFSKSPSSAYVFMIKYFDYVFMIRVFMIRV